MIEKRHLSRNALANVLQTIISAGLLFILYRYINMMLGVEQFGVWSVVLATVSASRLANFGLSAGVIRFVALYRARGEQDCVGQVIDTTTLTLMVSVGAVLPLLYPLLTRLLPHLFQIGYLVQAQVILPYAMASIWLTIVASVFQGGLDGCQRMDLRAGLVVAGQGFMLMLALWLVPQHGLIGLALAQIGQGLFLVMVGRLLLKRTSPELPWLPQNWRKHMLLEMLGYGTNIQIASIFMLLLDPITKAFMAHFGGPAAAGYFEMANQVVLKIRALIVTANRAVVPYVAVLTETEPARLTRLYYENMRMITFVVLPSFALLITWSGGISWLLTGLYKHEFVFMLGFLAFAWANNIICGPAYFTNMGTGEVGWNTFTHIIMGVLNVVLGWLLGSIYGAHGVILAYASALIISSWVLIVLFQFKNRLGWQDAIGNGHIRLSIVCVAVIILGWIMPLHPIKADPMTLVVGLVLPPLVLGLAAWFHPMRRHLIRLIMARDARA